MNPAAPQDDAPRPRPGSAPHLNPTSRPTPPAPSSSSPPPASGREVEIAPRVRVPESALRFTYTASSGPGGQNVNKRATRAQLRVALADLPISEPHRERLREQASHLLAGDELLIASDETRSQRRNRDRCLDKLREAVLRSAQAPKRRRPTRPSRGSIERRLSEKKSRGERKQMRRPPDLS